MPASPLIVINKFMGTDNVSDVTQLGTKYLHEAYNVDIDNQHMIHRRKGSTLLASTATHSVWSDGVTCLAVQGTSFGLVNTDFSFTPLITHVDPDDRIAYATNGRDIFFANHSLIGYVRDRISYPFPDPQQTYKIRMIGGQLLEYYNNRLYAANDHILYYSDPTVLTRMDARKNAIPMPGYITAVNAVVDGLYISAGDIIYWLGGHDATDFSMKRVAPVPAIEGTGITVEGDNVGRGVRGRTVYMTTRFGVYKGYPDGNMLRIQDERFRTDNLEIGTAMVHEINGYRQYLAIARVKAGLGETSIDVPLPIIDINATEA